MTYLEPREWSPDGKWIAANLYDKKNAGQMGLINVQDGSLHVLKSGSGRSDNPLFGRFSPDGKYVVYTRNTPGGSDRGYVLSVDGKSEMPLVSGSASAKSPVWMPDGSRIVFVSDRSGTPSLWHVRVVDGKPQDEPELLKAGFSYAPLGFTRNGSLYYDVSFYATDIYVAGLDPGTGRLSSVPKRVNERVGNSWGRVAWLPDGKSLSYRTDAPLWPGATSRKV